MIRINLIGGGAGQKSRKGGAGLRLPDIPNVGILLFVLFVVMEAAVFYMWMNTASEEATRAKSQLERRKLELTKLEENKKVIAQATEEIKKLREQKTVLDELFAEKDGPAGALQYFSFILQPRQQHETPTADLVAFEAAGWHVGWDARRAWITSYHENGGEVTIQGRALGHEDVAELQWRLESSPYFREPKLVYQEKKRDEQIGMTYVEFSIRATLIYLIEPVNPEKPDDKAAAAAGADAGSTDAGADTGGSAGDDAAVIGTKLALPLPGAATGDAADDSEQAPDTQGDNNAKGSATDASAEDVRPAPKPEPAKAEPAKAEAGSDLPKDDGKAPMPGAHQAAEPPPAAAPADKMPAAE